MAIEKMDMTPGQEILVARARAVTIAQFEIARELLGTQLGLNSDMNNDELLKVVQIIATNYAASVAKNA